MGQRGDDREPTRMREPGQFAHDIPDRRRPLGSKIDSRSSMSLIHRLWIGSQTGSHLTYEEGNTLLDQCAKPPILVLYRWHIVGVDGYGGYAVERRRRGRRRDRR